MRYSEIGILVLVACSMAAQAQSKSSDRCSALKSVTLTGVEFTNAEPVPAGKTIAPAHPGASAVGPLPAHCRVDGMINRRKGADALEFGIGFSVALPQPSAWKARKTISIKMSVENPQSSDDVVNNSTPKKKTRRRPYWLLILPAMGNAMTLPRL